MGLIGKTLNDEDVSTRQIPKVKGRAVCWIGLGMGGKWFSVLGYQGVTVSRSVEWGMTRALMTIKVTGF